MRRIVWHEIGAYRRKLADPACADYAAWDAHLKTAENDSGELALTIAPANPEYTPIASLLSELVVEDDGAELWRGRVTEQAIDCYGRKRLVAKGVLDYLHDTAPEPQTFTGTTSAVFSALLNAHNARPIEARKRIKIGSCSVSAQVDALTANGAQTTWALLDSLIKKYGGYLVMRREGGESILDWAADRTHINSQTVRIGVNLLDLKQELDPGDIVTVMYGYGKTTDGTALNFAAQNGGKKYVTDADAVRDFGWIEGAYTDSACTDAAALLAAAKAELKKRLAKTRTITASAVDLYDLGRSAERIEAGHYISVVAPALGIDETVPCTQVDRWLWDPQKTKITFCGSARAISSLMGGKV